MTVEKAQVHKNVVLMHIKGIDTVEAAEAISMGLCSLALLGQIFEYNVRVYAQDFSALLDTSFAIRFCAVVLFLLAAVVNAGVCMYQMKRSVKQHPQH